MAKYFGTSDRFWLNLQTRYDLELQRDAMRGVLADITPLPRS
jgi:plasmid maintenance system antidote protein VapI